MVVLDFNHFVKLELSHKEESFSCPTWLDLANLL